MNNVVVVGNLISGNRRHGMGRGRIITTQAYTNALNALAFALSVIDKVQGECYVLICGITNKDGDNIEKSIFDALQASGVIEDDANIMHHETIIRRKKNRNQIERILVMVKPYEPSAETEELLESFQVQNDAEYRSRGPRLGIPRTSKKRG